VLQALLGGVAGVLVLFRLYRDKLLAVFRRKPKDC